MMFRSVNCDFSPSNLRLMHMPKNRFFIPTNFLSEYVTATMEPSKKLLKVSKQVASLKIKKLE